ncbi:MAG: Nif11-like leader peptide family natural product precursor [Hydrococcus sp. RM1_1_31]|nr:Nif11-like leader peptide family natural product precursor [Hydrococcus sp. RM1_1_31]
MSVKLLDKVKEFLVRLFKDQAFRDRLTNSSVEERNQYLESDGYSFTKEEFEAATLEVIESKERGEFNELSEEELTAVVGGYVGETSKVLLPMYGVPWWPIDKKPKLPIAQPMYGLPWI